jgi:hypothetical protein
MSWVRTWEHGPEYLESLDGVEWSDCPPPPDGWWARRRHRHAAQTRGLIDRNRIARCVCGAIEFDGDGIWVNEWTRSR